LLETRTKEKASSAVKKLLDLQPRMTQIIRRKGEEEEKEKEQEVPIDQVQERDIFVVRSGEKKQNLFWAFAYSARPHTYCSRSSCSDLWGRDVCLAPISSSSCYSYELCVGGGKFAVAWGIQARLSIISPKR
jgi:hypothetical protein